MSDLDLANEVLDLRMAVPRVLLLAHSALDAGDVEAEGGYTPQVAGGIQLGVAVEREGEAAVFGIDVGDVEGDFGVDLWLLGSGVLEGTGG